MGPIDITGVAVALPAMGDDLGLSFSVGIWVSAAYLLTYTLALAPIGRIADHWGRLRLWRIGLVIFGGTSALIAAMSVSSPTVGAPSVRTWIVSTSGSRKASCSAG